jgi:hypothetical protein
LKYVSSKPVQFIYALIAAVLLLQSLAIWHDAEHAFHEEHALCDTLNAINHTPLADVGGRLLTNFFSTSVEYSFVSKQLLIALPRFNLALIRAPPSPSLFSL